MLAAASEDGSDPVARLFQQTDKFKRLVGRNSAADDEENLHPAGLPSCGVPVEGLVRSVEAKGVFPLQLWPKKALQGVALAPLWRSSKSERLT